MQNPICGDAEVRANEMLTGVQLRQHAFEIIVLGGVQMVQQLLLPLACHPIICAGLLILAALIGDELVQIVAAAGIKLQP